MSGARAGHRPGPAALEDLKLDAEYDPRVLGSPAGLRIPVGLDLIERRLRKRGIVHVPLSQMFALTPMPDRPLLLWRRWSRGLIDDRELRFWLADLWIEAWVAMPMTCQLPEDRWVAMFRALGFVSNRRGITAPTEPIVAYRGATKELAYGMSWTPDRWTAEFFIADEPKRGRQGYVWRATIPPAAVLAILRYDGSGTTEIVVDPDALPDDVVEDRAG